MSLTLLSLLLALGGGIDLHAPAPAVDGASEQTVQITLSGGDLRASDIAFVERGEDLVIAQFPAGASVVSMTEDKRRALLRNRIPAREFSLRHDGVLRVKRGAAAPKPKIGGPCFTARIELAAGAYITLADAAETECEAGAIERRLGYDVAAAAPIARVAIPVGSYLGRLPLRAEAPVEAGRALLLQTRVGPVIVERAVTSLHPGRAGQRIWVRTADGQLAASTLAVPSAKEQQ